MHTHGEDRRRSDETADVDTMFGATVFAVAAVFTAHTFRAARSAHAGS